MFYCVIWLAGWILQSSSVVKAFLPRTGISKSRRAFDLRSNFLVEEFNLKNWGVFDEATIFLQKPCFAVITGESASGKSVLLSALQSMCEGSSAGVKKSNRIAFDERYNREQNGGSQERMLSLTTLSGRSFRRLYDKSAKKFVCEIDGSRSSLKSIAEALKEDIRFWEPDDLQVLGSGSEGIVRYVDMSIGAEGRDLLAEIQQSHEEWSESYSDLQRLRKLEKRMRQGDETNTLTFFLREVSDFEDKLVKVLTEVQDVATDLYESMLAIPHDDEEEEHGEKQVEGEEEESNNDTMEKQQQLQQAAGSSSSNSNANANEAAEQSALLALIDLIGDALPAAPSQTQKKGGRASSIAVGSEAASATGKKKRGSSSSKASAMSLEVPDIDTAGLGLDYAKSREALEIAGRLFTDLNREISAVFPSASTSSNSGAKSQSLGSKNSGSGSGLGLISVDAIESVLDSYCDRVADMQKGFRKIGCSSAGLDNQLEKAQEALQEAIMTVREAQAAIRIVQRSLPESRSSIVDRVQSLSQEWDTLCRKHGNKYVDLQALQQQWQRDLASMANIITELPLQQRNEAVKRKAYVRLAYRLTDMRVKAAGTLINQVNGMLPSLEIRDKEIGARVSIDMSHITDYASASSSSSSARDDEEDEDEEEEEDEDDEEEEDDSENLLHRWQSYLSNLHTSGTAGTATGSLTSEEEDELFEYLASGLKPINKITRRGWDEIITTVHLRSTNGNTNGNSDSNDNDSGSSGEESSNVAALRVNNVVVRVISDSSLHAAGAGIEEDAGNTGSSSSSSSRQQQQLSIDVLSSGEKTRLALAMELCSGTSNIDKQTSASKEQHGDAKGLLVLDEIDAHVGGEAAVAVARLLRGQGRWRQVLAVTHNPVIAAAADKHFVVTKLNNGEYNIVSNTLDRPRSTLEEVNGDQREAELARMATGKLDTDAGLTLAKALLTANYE